MPEVYELEHAKYQDHQSRIEIPNRALPILNCTWGDVLQFCPLHPHIMADAITSARMSPQNLDFYEIPIDRVSHLPAVMYFGMDQDPIYELIRWPDFKELLQIPEATINWYQQLASRNLKGAIFNGIPHVMIHGEVDIKDCEIVTMRS